MGWFGIEKKAFMAGAVDSILGEQAKFKGEFFTKGSVNINGEFEGKLEAEGEVIISAGSKVVGDIYGGTVVVSGQVEGHIVASQNLEITKTGRVHGDLKGGRVLIEEGSSYSGKVEITSSAETDLSEKTPLFQEI